MPEPQLGATRRVKNATDLLTVDGVSLLKVAAPRGPHDEQDLRLTAGPRPGECMAENFVDGHPFHIYLGQTSIVCDDDEVLARRGQRHQIRADLDAEWQSFPADPHPDATNQAVRVRFIVRYRVLLFGSHIVERGDPLAGQYRCGPLLERSLKSLARQVDELRSADSID
jgi:hypothetical protein